MKYIVTTNEPMKSFKHKDEAINYAKTLLKYGHEVHVLTFKGQNIVNVQIFKA